MTFRRAARRGAAGAALATAVVLLLTGCLTGDGTASAFAHEFGDDPAVSRLDLSSADNMPFSGGVGGTVYLQDEIETADLDTVSQRIGEFGSDKFGSDVSRRMRIDVVFDQWRIPVLADSGTQTDLLGMVADLRVDDRVRGGTVSSNDDNSGVGHVTVVATDGTVIRSLFTDVQVMTAALTSTAALTLRLPAEGGTSVEISGRAGAWSDAAFTLYDALRAEIALTAFRASETDVSATLRDEGDLDRARSIVASLGLNTTVAFPSELVTLFPGATGDEARRLLADLDSAARGSITSVWTNDSAATLTLGSRDDVQRVATAVSATSTPLESLTLRVGTPDAPTVELTGAPSELAADAVIALDLLAGPRVSALRVQPGHSMQLDLDAALSEVDFADFAAPLKSLSRSGERVCIVGTEGTVCVDAEVQISTADVTDDARSFVDAWNAAPRRP